MANAVHVYAITTQREQTQPPIFLGDWTCLQLIYGARLGTILHFLGAHSPGEHSRNRRAHTTTQTQ